MTKRQARNIDAGWAYLRTQILEAKADVDATVTKDGRRLRAHNVFRYTLLGGGTKQNPLASNAYLQTWFREMRRRGAIS